MNNLNSILIEGNLVRDPVLRHTPKGTAVCTFTIASNRFNRKDAGEAPEKEVSVFDIVAWWKLAEACYQNGYKGRGVRVVGRLKQERWVGADGKEKARVVIVAEHCEYRPDFNKRLPKEPELFQEERPAEDGELSEYAEVAAETAVAF